MSDTGNINVSADTASVTLEAKPAPPILPGINMPDHPIRNTWQFQLFVRLARPTLDWIGNIGAAYALFLGHWFGRPMAETYAVVTLCFVAALYGLKTYEKQKGVA